MRTLEWNLKLQLLQHKLCIVFKDFMRQVRFKIRSHSDSHKIQHSEAEAEETASFPDAWCPGKAKVPTLGFKSLTIWTFGSFSLTMNPTWCSLLLLLLYSAPWSRSSYSSAYVFSFSLRLLVSLLSRSFAGSCCCRPASSSLLLLSLHKPAFLHLSYSSTKFPSSPPYRPS